jgi:hypothetical protein
MRPGAGPTDTIRQRGFDTGIVNMLGMQAAARQYGSLREADGRRVPPPAEQIVRDLGAADSPWRRAVTSGHPEVDNWPTSGSVPRSEP